MTPDAVREAAEALMRVLDRRIMSLAGQHDDFDQAVDTLRSALALAPGGGGAARLDAILTAYANAHDPDRAAFDAFWMERPDLHRAFAAALDASLAPSSPPVEAVEMARAAAYTLCNGEPGAVPGKYMRDIALTLEPFFAEALSAHAPAAAGTLDMRERAARVCDERADINLRSIGKSNVPDEQLRNNADLLRGAAAHIRTLHVLPAPLPAAAGTVGEADDYEKVIDPYTGETLYRRRIKAPQPTPTAPTRPEIVCICGSTRFAAQMNVEGERLTLAGKIVVRPEVVAYDRGRDQQFVKPEEKAALDELHKRKIDLADRVFVVNVGGYVGSSTRSEIDYAVAHGKPVTYLEDGVHSTPPPPTAPGDAERSGVSLIAIERRRQVDAEGWTPEHDDAHDEGERAGAAASYAAAAQRDIAEGPLRDGFTRPCGQTWRWSAEWWKPTTPLRNLVKAGALIAAEIDRLLRAEQAAAQEGGRRG